MTISETAASLIKIASVSGEEQAIADYIEQWVARHAPMASLRRYGNNILAVLPGVNSQKALIFNGHIDTVKPGQRQLWQSDPLVARRDNGRLYGLGTSDMKGADAVMLHLLAQYSQAPPECDVLCMFVCQEETTGAGTRELLDIMEEQLQRYQSVAGVVGEATELMVALGHRGNVFIEATFSGEGGHASNPGTQEAQAVQRAVQFVEQLNQAQQQWVAEFPDSLLGAPSVTVTRIIAGAQGSVNQVPTQCTVAFDLRTNPQFHAKVAGVVAPIAARYQGTISVLADSPPGSCSPNEPIAQIALKLAGQGEPQVRRGSTDQCFFGTKGIPAIICGPGTLSAIHAPNEFIIEEMLDKAFLRYKALVQEWAA